MSDIPASFTASWQENFILNTLELPLRAGLIDELWRRRQAHVGARASHSNAVLEILSEEGIELA